MTVHSRYSGSGAPSALIAIDIVRIEDGRLQSTGTSGKAKSLPANPRAVYPCSAPAFRHNENAASMPNPQLAKKEKPMNTKSSQEITSISIEAARKIVAPLYEALNEPSKKDVDDLLAKATNPDYRSYSTNSEWLSREQLAGVFKMMGSAIPDLRWTVEDIQTIGDQIIVRGRATGTPTGEFWGTKPTGKSFDTMAIDIFTVRNGKLATAYHLENWAGALQQIAG